MNAIYTHHEIDTLRQAVSKMPKVLVPSVELHFESSMPKREVEDLIAEYIEFDLPVPDNTLFPGIDFTHRGN
jgi:hypothetical protein